MAIWIAISVGCGIGLATGGWRSLKEARQGDLGKAVRSVKHGGRIAAVTAVAVTFLLLGWPLGNVSVSAPEEVTRTVVETVQVPVQVTRWLFWSTTRQEAREVEKQITETVVHTRTAQQFSWLLLGGLGFVAAIANTAQRLLVRLLWTWWG